ncbi:MAG: replicative DNA helicase [Mycoplasmataceae bacterium]|nr:replicative DNA helicase [Mycoplasmataceae bacterium]
MAKELFSEKTERALLGLIIVNPNLVKIITGAITSDDFFFTDNGLIFTSIINSFDIHGVADEVLLVEELSKISDKPKVEWLTYIASLIMDKGIETNIEKYIELLREKKYTRELERSLKDSVKIVSKGGSSVADLIGQVESKIQNVTKQKELKDFSDVKTLTSKLQVKMKKMEEGGFQDGIRTKFSTLDNKLGGLQGGQFIVVAARPSMGKTAFALELSKNISKTHNVGFFSLEMPSEQLILRLISSEAMIESRWFTQPNTLNQKAQERIQYAIETVKKLNLWIDDSASLRVGELAWKARKLSDLNNLDMIVVDYLQLIDSEIKGSDNRQQAISEISRQLKSLARELNIPVIALSQLSRRVEQREEKRPQMSDIRESGAIEQDADIIMFLYREDYYKNKEETTNNTMSDLEIIISKHRNGSTGIVKFGFERKFGSFTPVHTSYKKG